MAAGALLVREAGGTVSAIERGAFRAETAIPIFASNGAVHEQTVLRCLQML